MKRIVILGSGFGGVEVVRNLCRKRNSLDMEISLVDRNNYFLFTPLLHEVAVGSIGTRNLLQPIRILAKKLSFQFLQREIKDIRLNSKTVISERQDIPYDILVIALGRTTNFFGIPGARENTFTLGNLTDAIKIRNHIIRILEKADAETHPAKRKTLLTFTVVGAGHTGVQTVAAMHDFLMKAVGEGDQYPNIKESEIRVVLVEATSKILRDLNPSLSDFALLKLRQKKIEVHLESTVTHVTPNEVKIKGQKTIPTHTTIWATGVGAIPVIDSLPIPKDRSGRILVDKDLRISSHPEVFALGDNAAFMTPSHQNPLPPTAQVAIQEGRVIADNILRLISGHPTKPFIYKHRGTLVSLGSRSGVAEIYGFRFHGFLAWFLWRTFYFSRIISLRKKIQVGVDWTLDVFFDPDLSEIKIR